MSFLTLPILAWLILIPVLGGLLLLLIPGKKVTLLRWCALGISLIPLVLSIILWVNYQPKSEALFQFEMNLPWFAAIHSSLHLGIDGLSLVMVLLTALL
ncbi:NADH-quinone oxidoreductase subunit M, partial [bacterium]|nr:NADH-quinone oxidoreductase subunit M [bacterium]